MFFGLNMWYCIALYCIAWYYVIITLPMSPACGIALHCIVLHGIMLLLLCQRHQHVVLHCIVLYCMALCYYCSAYIANMCLCKTIWCSDDEDRTQRIILNQPRQGLREQNHLLFVSTIICYLYHLLFAICINCQGISNHAQLISWQRCKWCFVLSQRVRGVQDTQNYQSYLHFFNSKFLFDPPSCENALLTQIGLTQK